MFGGWCTWDKDTCCLRCSVCIEVYGSGSKCVWTGAVGNLSIKFKTVKEHAMSATHLEALAARTHRQALSASVDRALTRRHPSICSLTRTVYALCCQHSVSCASAMQLGSGVVMSLAPAVVVACCCVLTLLMLCRCSTNPFASSFVCAVPQVLRDGLLSAGRERRHRHGGRRCVPVAYGGPGAGGPHLRGVGRAAGGAPAAVALHHCGGRRVHGPRQPQEPRHLHLLPRPGVRCAHLLPAAGGHQGQGDSGCAVRAAHVRAGGR